MLFTFWLECLTQVLHFPSSLGLEASLRPQEIVIRCHPNTSLRLIRDAEDGGDRRLQEWVPEQAKMLWETKMDHEALKTLGSDTPF